MIIVMAQRWREAMLVLCHYLYDHTGYLVSGDGKRAFMAYGREAGVALGAKKEQNRPMS